jgi:hypothetical protein
MVPALRCAARTTQYAAGRDRTPTPIRHGSIISVNQSQRRGATMLTRESVWRAVLLSPRFGARVRQLLHRTARRLSAAAAVHHVRAWVAAPDFLDGDGTAAYRAGWMHRTATRAGDACRDGRAADRRVVRPPSRPLSRRAVGFSRDRSTTSAPLGESSAVWRAIEIKRRARKLFGAAAPGAGGGLPPARACFTGLAKQIAQTHDGDRLL